MGNGPVPTENQEVDMQTYSKHNPPNYTRIHNGHTFSYVSSMLKKAQVGQRIRTHRHALAALHMSALHRSDPHK